MSRILARLATVAVTLGLLSGTAAAQDKWPSRPVTVIVPFAAGGNTDVMARIFAEQLTKRLGQQFIVENRPGANGNLATEGIVKAPADGHSLLMIAPANTINATLFDNLSFNFVRDIAPVAGMLRTFYVMVVNPSFPAKTVPEFIAYAKANRGKISYASAGAGTPQHVSAELFKMLTGVQMQHVPYRGSIPGLTDLIGGQVQVMFDNMATALEHVRSGRLRALGVTTATRAPVLPDVPTIGEFVPGFDVSAQFGIGAPRNTPAAVIQTLNREINAGLADPAIKARLDQLNGVVTAATPVEFGKLLTDETEKWAKVIKFGGIKAD